MTRFLVLLTILATASPCLGASTTAPKDLRDLYYGEALYHAFQGEWFDAIARLDTELAQYHRVDEPVLDTLHYHANEAEFAVGDFELAYRMHHRAGRAITAVIEGNVAEPVRNEAIFRLARIFFQKDQPENAFYALERIRGAVPAEIREELVFLRAQVLMANGRYSEAAAILKQLQGVEGLEGFATYNLGIAKIREGDEKAGRQYLDGAGLIDSDQRATMAIRDKSNLVLGYKLLEEDKFEGAKQVLDRVRLTGPFSNRALLGSGWADASQGRFERALVPWTILVTREITDSAVQEAMLALPYAYGKLNVYGKAALLYGKALEAFGAEIDKLGASIESIREGKFLRALVREELKQDANWVVKLRELPETPETYYLLDLMASHDFQSSLKNYLDLEELRKKLSGWARSLEAFEDIIERRRAYYQPLLPAIDRKFRQLDSQMRLRLEQRELIAKRLQAMLVAPRPDYLATAAERLDLERLNRLEKALLAGGRPVPGALSERLQRLRGVIEWHLYTEYDARLTETYKHLRALNEAVDRLQAQYTSFVRTRQAATQSFEGYDEVIRRERIRLTAAEDRVGELMARQGHLLETMAVNELDQRRDRLTEFQVKARFALADSYDRATRAQAQESVDQ